MIGNIFDLLEIYWVTYMLILSKNSALLPLPSPISHLPSPKAIISSFLILDCFVTLDENKLYMFLKP